MASLESVLEQATGDGIVAALQVLYALRSRDTTLHALKQGMYKYPQVLLNVRVRQKPDLRDHFKMQPFETNSHGMRDREYSPEKPPNTFRIAVVGDSFTMGSGVAIEDVFHSRIESRQSD